MKIAFDTFTGEIPRLDPRYLPPNNAAKASDARFNRGSLEPMRASVVTNTFGAAAASFYLHGSTYLSWTVDVDAVPGPVAEDRLYVTKATGAPQLLYSGTYYGLAVPSPNVAPALSRTGTLDPTLQETIIYAFTWVTSLGEESAPSPVSAGIEWSPGCDITVAMAAAVPASRLITHKRIYRSVTSASGATELFFVAEVPATTASFVHDLEANPTVEAITSRYFDTPVDTLRGLIAMPNGMMAAFSGRDLYFCEPYKPHAWPDKYALTVNADIVGLVAFGSSLAVLTTSTPYVVQGIHPESMAMERLEILLPCVSKRSIVDMGYAAIYASTDGLVQISQSGAQLISGSLWTKEQWAKTITPATIRAGFLMGRYVMSFQPGATGDRKLAIVELDQAGAFVSSIDGEQIIDFHYHIESGRLLGLKADGLNVASLDDNAAALKSYLWRSKPMRIPAPTSFGVAMIDARPPETGVTSFACKVYADGRLLRTILKPNSIERIPDPPSLALIWEIEITGNCTVTRAIIANTPDEVWQ